MNLDTLFYIASEIVPQAIQGDRIHTSYDHLQWMKLGEIARYWAAKELTQFDLQPGVLEVRAPFAAEQFTVRVETRADQCSLTYAAGERIDLKRVEKAAELTAGCWLADQQATVVCFDLRKGNSTIQFRA